MIEPFSFSRILSIVLFIVIVFVGMKSLKLPFSFYENQEKRTKMRKDKFHQLYAADKELDDDDSPE